MQRLDSQGAVPSWPPVTERAVVAEVPSADPAVERGSQADAADPSLPLDPAPLPNAEMPSLRKGPMPRRAPEAVAGRTTTNGVQWNNTMRTALLALGFGVVCLLAAWSLSNRWVAFPLVSPPGNDVAYAGVEPVCLDTMRQRPPDLTWVAPGRDAMLRGRTIRPTALANTCRSREGLCA